ncbi:hypothetical protein AAG589_04340 [Isoptericola sp. F-RaC21]|uniref:hypothetical protein n=1 Tax=Isoptericola sp. F-RaC21 TaxID=3141452 RepID=UPI00315BFDA5
MITRDELDRRSGAAGGGDDRNLPLLTLAEFFDGNDDEESLAPNQWGEGRPPLADVRRRLEHLAAHDGVAWVRVELHEESVEDGVDWIAAEAVAVCTTLVPEEVEDLVGADELQADGVVAGYVYPEDWFSEVPEVPEGHRVLSLVWD